MSVLRKFINGGPLDGDEKKLAEIQKEYIYEEDRKTVPPPGKYILDEDTGDMVWSPLEPDFA